MTDKDAKDEGCRHLYRVYPPCGARACIRCGRHEFEEECFCGYVDPGVRRHRAPWLVFREDARETMRRRFGPRSR